MKRAFDIILSFFGIVLLSPVFLALTLWVKLGSKGPVFYRGERVGLLGRDFRIFKYRSMVVNADKIGGSSTGEDDPRVTAAGRFLRKYKLDELPQLFNVLFGDMSLVGPRPQVRWAVELYSEEEKALLTVRPGITDYASLVFRNEGEILKGSTDPDKDYLIKIAPGKIRLGLEYVRNHSVLTDCKIILATLGALAGKDPAWCLPRHLSHIGPPADAVRSIAGETSAR